jgi:hypothetical protein
MPAFIDARLPVIFGPPGLAGPEDALLIEGEGEGGDGGDAAPGRDWFLPDMAAGHPADCACCPPRGGAGMALARLILARGRGTGPFFRRVIAVTRTPQGAEAVRRALAQDPIASAYFRAQD